MDSTHGASRHGGQLHRQQCHCGRHLRVPGRQINIGCYTGTGYVYAGINAPLTENRGKVLLLVDNTFTTALSAELSRLEQDLVGDGWTVVRRDISRNDTPANIKSLIKSEYNADPTNLQSVFLFGHVPVPYSGNLCPDGHDDNNGRHKGAWAADVYYADMHGTWTDKDRKSVV